LKTLQVPVNQGLRHCPPVYLMDNATYYRTATARDEEPVKLCEVDRQ